MSLLNFIKRRKSNDLSTFIMMILSTLNNHANYCKLLYVNLLIIVEHQKPNDLFNFAVLLQNLIERYPRYLP